ncbi:MAG: hypothetical protein J5880_03675 [Bacilli bacterium]|nr:hypothetical protein [Bacilli bacterium]
MDFKDIPLSERPREKATRLGFESLNDAELLAILVNSGTKGSNTLEIANELLKMSKGLYNLSTLNQCDLKTIKGINKVKSGQLLALFTLMDRIKRKKIDLEDRVVDADYINEKYGDYLASLSQEVVVLLILNRSKKLLFERTLYKGDTSLVPVSINEVIKNVILHDGYYFYLVHNHPNGNTEPSPQDLLLTFRLNTTVKNLGIYCLDHIIIHGRGYTSVNKYLSIEYNYRNLLPIQPVNSKTDYEISKD